MDFPAAPANGLEPFDGKRHRRAIQRKTIDYNSSVINLLIDRQTKLRSSLQPSQDFVSQLYPVFATNATSAITTKFVHMSMNKQRCPINVVKWTPEGRRLITGSSSGEFTLWNGLTFNFETIMQAHDKAIRAMQWSHNDTWMLTADDSGVIKYWQSNMNNLKAFQAHKDVVRDLTFSPTDGKFASCSDDGTIKIYNFLDASEERCLTGHGWDVKCIDWHPTKGLLASGSKDNLVKLWDPKTGNSLTTLHGHKHTITGLEWNRNGNWLLTSSRDCIIRLFDIRTMKEIQSYKGHKKEATAIAWHPQHENLFTSGGADGSILFWMANEEEQAGGMECAHDNGAVWSLDWHPMGHMLASGSNDFSTRFWTRNRPGDLMRERYDMDRAEAESLGLLNAAFQDDDDEADSHQIAPSVYSNLALNMAGSSSFNSPAIIPGMGIGAQIQLSAPGLTIPGLGSRNPGPPAKRPRQNSPKRQQRANPNTAPVGQRSVADFYSGGRR